MNYIAPIAKWRINSDEERNLAKKADADFAARKDYVEYLKKMILCTMKKDSH